VNDITCPFCLSTHPNWSQHDCPRRCPACKTYRRDETHVCPGSIEWELKCAQEDKDAAEDRWLNLAWSAEQAHRELNQARAKYREVFERAKEAKN
jgi:hypothetical protein